MLRGALYVALCALLLCTGACRKRTNPDGSRRFPLVALRAELKTKVHFDTERFDAPEPPPGVLEKVFDWAISEGAEIAKRVMPHPAQE